MIKLKRPTRRHAKPHIPLTRKKIIIGLVAFGIIAVGATFGSKYYWSHYVNYSKEVTEHQTAVFATQTQQDPSVPAGKEVVAQEGSNGEKLVVYKVSYHNRKEASKTVLRSVYIHQPKPKIVKINTATASKSTTTKPKSTASTKKPTTKSTTTNPSQLALLPKDMPKFAKCNDGKYSIGTKTAPACADHGGIAQQY